MCKLCGEPATNHRLCGIEIHPAMWHYVFSGGGLELVPSDGEPYRLMAADVAKVNIPDQRTTSGRGKRSHKKILR